MNPWIEKTLVLAGTAVMIGIRAPPAQWSSNCQGGHKLENNVSDAETVLG